MDITQEYTKDGLKLTHPSGFIQTLSIYVLTNQEKEINERILELQTDLKDINAHITQLLNLSTAP